MNIDENIFRMPIYPMLNNMNIDELNISFYVKPSPLHSRLSHILLTTIEGVARRSNMLLISDV